MTRTEAIAVATEELVRAAATARLDQMKAGGTLTVAEDGFAESRPEVARG